jgi:2-desacetyl-2-hydroxyethyl bacteriochlorophyllide A dehydrogenase
VRAVVMRAGRVDVDEVQDAAPGRGQLLIAPHATGICGSDLHLRHALAELASASPEAPVMSIVPGHEFAGEVVAIGPDAATDLVVGDLVTAIPFTHGAAGPETIGLSATFGGGLAELTAVDAERTIRLPDGLGTRLGALCEPIAVAVHAFARAAERGPIVVVGAGPIGLGIIAVAAVAGRHPILAVEPSPTRRATAVQLGCDAAHEPGPGLLELLAELGYRPSTISPLLDSDPTTTTIFECVGRPEVVQSILADAPPHSRVVLAGACMHSVEISPLQLTTTEVSIETSFAYRPHEFRVAADHLLRHPDLFNALITSERPLDDAEAAFDALASQPDEVKILMNPNGGRP